MLYSCPFNLDRPTNRVLWEITGSCNMNCKHCLYYSNRDKQLAGDLSLEAIYHIIQQMQEDSTIDEVWLSGGEPLMRKDILSIINRIYSCGMKPSISTNGYLVDASVAADLKLNGVNYVHLSIDGVNETSHDQFRQKSGAFKHVLSAARFLYAVDIIVGATCIITWKNIEEINQIVKLAIENNIKVLSFYMIEPLGRGRVVNRNLDINLMENLSEKFNHLIQECGNLIHLELFRTCSTKEPLRPCKCYNFLTITNDGKLGGCPWLMKSDNNPVKIDLNIESFTAAKRIVQNELKLFAFQRETSLSKCFGCSLNDSCGRGCPAVSDNDLIDPLCNYLRDENGQNME